ncbi:MAG: MgtC/SapB family protein [Ruminococcaceae bacterium]|nr:MgtC/SapB family protein [Oscillospiraceae bacterium]
MMEIISIIVNSFIFKVVLRLAVAVLVGVVIGSERAKHGRAAGMRTHVLVALGSCLTSLMSVYVSQNLGFGGDVMRISAQVISGIGFLGAGMIIIKNNDVITGLTTAAGVWTTSIIGIALGYGFYIGAIICAALFLIAIVVFSKFEKRKRTTELVYIELDDLYKTNKTIEEILEKIGGEVTYTIIPPKSGVEGNIGLMITVAKKIKFDVTRFCELENVVFACEE